MLKWFVCLIDLEKHTAIDKQAIWALETYCLPMQLIIVVRVNYSLTSCENLAIALVGQLYCDLRCYIHPFPRGCLYVNLLASCFVGFWAAQFILPIKLNYSSSTPTTEWPSTDRMLSINFYNKSIKTLWWSG